VKTIILCGGQGARIRQETVSKPKPLIEVGGMPILLHIMRRYAMYGHKDFVLALGYKGRSIKDYFLNYQFMANDFTVKLGDGSIDVHTGGPESDWTVTLADTGEAALKGARIARVAKYLGDDERFMVTYGDGVANVDVDALVRYHEASGKIGTFTGVHMPSRFGSVRTDGEGAVLNWTEKPVLDEYINGGFFVFERAFLEYLSDDEGCDLEREPLERLAADGELSMYPHEGSWHCLDTYRDMVYLNELWGSGQADWGSP
jgi:glucose-1-phosphate cytidylyltransferase